MKKNTFEYPKSSFLGMQKDIALIMDKILKNQRLLKLIYYNSRDWDKKPDLKAKEINSLFDNKQISIVPKVKIDEKGLGLTYLRLTFDSFTPNDSNDYYKDHIVELKIICHFDDWDLGEYDLRPYRIAGELDSMLNKQHLTGIGELTFLSASQDIYDEEYGGVTLRYLAIRGNEDRVNPLE